MLGEFMTLFERAIETALYGDGVGKVGLYQSILSSQDWETFQRSKGRIEGYEAAQALATEIVRRLNEEPQQAKVGRW
jgi:hypothetical protein